MTVILYPVTRAQYDLCKLHFHSKFLAIYNLSLQIKYLTDMIIMQCKKIFGCVLLGNYDIGNRLFFLVPIH